MYSNRMQFGAFFHWKCSGDRQAVAAEICVEERGDLLVLDGLRRIVALVT